MDAVKKRVGFMICLFLCKVNKIIVTNIYFG